MQREIKKRALMTVSLVLLTTLSFARKPNIILILADDMGYGDLGCYGQQMIQTPNIDALAATGIRFTDYYSGNTVCAPSRESMLTGKTTGHTYIRGNFLTDQEEDPAMPEDKLTIAEMLKKAGYKTGLYGKWGLGGEIDGPQKQGFDSSFCYLDQIKAHNYYPPYLFNNGKRINIEENQKKAKGQYSHDLFVDKTLAFIRNTPENQPFFLYLPYTIPHGEYSLPPAQPYVSKNWPKTFKSYATMISKLDKDVARIVNLLRKNGTLENTIIVFTSDNGANQRFTKFFNSNGVFRGGKRDLYEGGIREPLLVSWKGKIKPGQTSHDVLAAWDIFPTLCQLAGIRDIPHTDGISFVLALLNKQQPKHDYLYWEFYAYNYNWYKNGEQRPRNYLEKRAIRYGNWKGIQNNLSNNPSTPIELYDLSTDPTEQHNVASDNPDITRRIMDYINKSSIPDTPYFPYANNDTARLHTFDFQNTEDVKKFFHYSPDRIPLVSSHRGGAALGFPENCIATFTHTLRHGWSIMETDPHYTRDSVIVLMHDPSLDRTSTGHGKISDYTLSELKGLNLKDIKGNITKYKIPTLDEVLEWAKGKTLLILDQKDVSAERRAKEITEHHAEANTMIMCYNYEDARKVYQINKNILMEVFIPDLDHAKAFAKSGVPWSNIIAFVTHNQPTDPGIFKYLHDKGVMAICGSSRNIDKQYLKDSISKEELEQGYEKIIQAGADIIEADLGVQAEEALQRRNAEIFRKSSKKKYFKMTPN